MGAALAGLLHATAGGAVVVAGLGLAVPGLIQAANPLEAVAQAVAFGLASLGVSLESGDVQGTFAPLSGLLLTLWGISSTVRRAGAKSPAPGVRQAAATGLCLGIACAGAAVAASSATTIEPSPPQAAVAGLLWGSVGAALGRLGPAGRPPQGGPAPASDPTPASDPAPASGPAPVFAPAPASGPAPAGAPPAGTPPGPPAPVPRAGASAGSGVALGLRPGLVTVGAALGLAFLWYLVAVVGGVAGGSARQVVGGILLALMAAPNAAAALVVVGVGGSVDVVLEAGLLERPLRESLSLFEGAGPYLLALAAVPAVAAAAGGRAAAAVSPRVSPVVRGLRNGAALTIALVVAARFGSLAATSAAEGDRLSVRLGFFPGVLGFAVALAWGVAGAYAGPRLPLPRRRPRVDGP